MIYSVRRFGLREEFEYRRSGGPDASLDTAAAAEQAAKDEQDRQFLLELGMPASLDYEQQKRWAKEKQFQADSAAQAFREKVVELEETVRKRGRQRLLDAGFSEELGGNDYVRYINCDDPRYDTYKAISRQNELEQKAISRVLGSGPAPSESQDLNEQTAPTSPNEASDEPDGLNAVGTKPKADQTEGDQTDAGGETPAPPATAVDSDSTLGGEGPPEGDAEDQIPVAGRLFRLFTNGIADARIEQAAAIVQADYLSTNDKLEKIDSLLPFPPTASAADMAALLRVSRQAVHKTDWWIRKRRGNKENEIDRREAMHRSRAELNEQDQPVEERCT